MKIQRNKVFRMYLVFPLTAVLLAGCGTQTPDASTADPSEEPIIEATPDPETERQARIDDALHSETIRKYTQDISNGTDAETYIKRGDEYLKIAIQEDYYDGYVFAFQDYVVACSLSGDLSDHVDKIVAIYDVKAQHAYEEGNLEDYEGFLVRANNLSPSQERYSLITKARKELFLQDANKELRTDYHDLDEELTSYAISKMDENGLRCELSTYTADDKLVDTYTGYEYDEHGNCLKSATFNETTLKFEDERVESFTEEGVQVDTKFYKLGTDSFLGSQVNIYDDLGRFAGIRYIDGTTGEDSGSLIYRYDENDQYIAYDVYYPSGELRYHEDIVQEDSSNE